MNFTTVDSKTLNYYKMYYIQIFFKNFRNFFLKFS